MPIATSSPSRHAAAAGVLALSLAALSGCSAKDNHADPVAGKKLFVQKCGSCHVLNRAGTKGVTGPNLDQAFMQSLADGLGRSGIRGLVRDQINHPSKYHGAPTGNSRNDGSIAMPSGLVNSSQADDIAEYVSQVTARPGKDAGLLATAVQSAASNTPAVAKNGTLSIPADPNGQLAYVHATATAPAGKLTIEMPNQSGIQHNISIKGKGAGAIVTKGVSKFTATFAPGKYTYFCEVPGHEQAGMKGTLTVK